MYTAICKAPFSALCWHRYVRLTFQDYKPLPAAGFPLWTEQCFHTKNVQ